MKIYSVNDPEFKQFGRVLHFDTSSILEAAKAVEMPESGSSYVPTLDLFEKLPIRDEIEAECFGGVSAQMGYCWGHNDTLNALEWHTCSEINVATKDDLILLLGDVRDLEPGARYDSAKVKAFRLKTGEAVEVYATSLHYCPIETAAAGFGCMVGLMKDTNTDLDKPAKDPLLFKKNKWIIAHEDNSELIAKGVFGGIYGENYTLKF